MAVMFRKSAVLAAGNYQSVPYFEDYGLWVRMDQKGFLGANLPITLVYARIGNDMIGRRQGLSYRRHELFFLRRARESGFDYSILVNEKNSGVSFPEIEVFPSLIPNLFFLQIVTIFCSWRL